MARKLRIMYNNNYTWKSLKCPIKYILLYMCVIYMYIVTYLGFACQTRHVLDLMIGFIGPMYNWLQQFTNHYLTHSHLLLTGNSTGTIQTSNWTPLYSSVLHQFWSEWRLTVPSCNSSAQTAQKTRSSVVKNACLLVRYLAVDILLLRAYVVGMCLPSHCLTVGICLTV
jgi:hypothetical protein